MKKDKKKNKVVEDNIDLSIIKENDLENTATFTDLLSRKERKQHKKNKNDDINDTISDNSIEFKTEELSSQIAENKTVEITEKERKKIIAEAKLEEETEEVIEKPVKEHNNIFNTVLISLIIISFIGLFVYSIIYTDILAKDLYLLIDGALLMLLVFNYCLMTISKRNFSIFFTIINYLIIIGIVSFNALIYFKII